MKRLLVFILIATFSFFLMAAEHSTNEDSTNQDLSNQDSTEDLFGTYRNNPIFENFLKAATHFDKLTDEDDSAHIMLSYLYFMELENNLKTLETKLDSLDLSGKFSYANLLLSLKRYDESIAVYDIINAEAPNWSCPWRHKGEALYSNNNLIDAELATLQAIETKVDHFDAYIQLSHIQHDMGNMELALQSMEDGLNHYSEDCEEDLSMIDVNFFHLKLLELNGRKKEFKKLSKKLKEIAPDNPAWNEFH